MRADASRLEQEARALVARYPWPAGALMPLLDLVLREGGRCDEARARWIAGLTGLPPGHVAGVASTRGARDGWRVCTGLSCRLMGAEAVLSRLAATPGVVAVGCLGPCSSAPVLARGDRLHDGLTAPRLEALLAQDASA